MGNRHHGAFEVVQEAFQPRYGFRIQVVGRFVEQQHVWFFQQQAAQRHATTLTTGKVSDFCVPVRQTQRIRRTLQLNVQVVTVVSLNDLFQTALFSGQAYSAYTSSRRFRALTTSETASSMDSRTVCSGFSCGSCGR